MIDEKRLKEMTEAAKLFGSSNGWTGTSGRLATIIMELIGELRAQNAVRRYRARMRDGELQFCEITDKPNKFNDDTDWVSFRVLVPIIEYSELVTAADRVGMDVNALASLRIRLGNDAAAARG